MFLLPLSSDHSVIGDSEEKLLRISPVALCFPFGPWRPLNWPSMKAIVGNGLCGFVNVTDCPRLDAVQWDNFSTVDIFVLGDSLLWRAALGIVGCLVSNILGPYPPEAISPSPPL